MFKLEYVSVGLCFALPCLRDSIMKLRMKSSYRTNPTFHPWFLVSLVMRHSYKTKLDVALPSAFVPWRWLMTPWSLSMEIFLKPASSTRQRSRNLRFTALGIKRDAFASWKSVSLEKFSSAGSWSEDATLADTRERPHQGHLFGYRCLAAFENQQGRAIVSDVSKQMRHWAAEDGVLRPLHSRQVEWRFPKLKAKRRDVFFWLPENPLKAKN